MLKKILIGLVLILGLIAVVAALQPSDFKVTRSITVSASPATVFGQVNDLHQWQAWSPWAKLDPNAKMDYQGPQAGVGSSFHWAGNKEVGEGTMTISESHPNDLVRFNLDFVKPFEGHNTAEFHFKPEGDRTVVDWSMEGKKNFIFKVVGLFVNCDKMVGGQFEKGLAELKTVSEAAPK